jgi:hypothetical protein
MLEALAAKDFDGSVLPFAERDSVALETVQDLAEQLGITLLPPLLMPFTKERLRESVAILLPEGTSGLGGHGRGGPRRLARALVSAED